MRAILLAICVTSVASLQCRAPQNTDEMRECIALRQFLQRIGEPEKVEGERAVIKRSGENIDCGPLDWNKS